MVDYEDDLKKLESNVERLLENLSNTQEDRERLLADFAQLEQDKKELEEQMEQLRSEKQIILQRVNGLLGSIEKWGKGVPSSVNVSSSKEHSEPVQGLLLGN